MAYQIEARNLSKHFGSVIAVDGLSLQVTRGEIYGLVGPDGAGKTTTMRLFCGALQPSRGDVTIAGYNVGSQTEKAREKIGYLPQRFSLYEELTAMENIRFFAEVRGIPATEWQPRCLEILRFVGLEPFKDRKTGQLSGGMKQKLGLAAALVHRPVVLLLDEPTTGVDPVTRQDFWQLIIRLAIEQCTTILISTPYMDEASRCGRVGFLMYGKLLVEDAPANLPALLPGRLIEIRGQPLALLRQMAEEERDVLDAHLFGDRLHLRFLEENQEEVMARLKIQFIERGGQIEEVRLINGQLEDVFLSLLKTQDQG